MRRHDGLPIVVGGCHRSGTSLLRRLLNAHPRIHCGPEIKFWRDFHGDFEADDLQHLRFATTVKQVLGDAEALAVLGGALVDVQERAARHHTKPRWADKNPENVLYWKSWQQLLADRWLLVHVTRNPLDTIGSMLEAAFPKTLPQTLEGCIAFYRRYNAAGLAFASQHPDRYRRLVYEDLVLDPAAGLTELMRWLGEESSPSQLAFADLAHGVGLEDPKIHHTSGVHSSSLRRWRAVLTDAQVLQIWGELESVWRELAPANRYGATWLGLDGGR